MLNLNDNGSNIGSFNHLFTEGVGGIFQNAIARSFSYATEVVRTVRESSVSHQLELWDQAASFKLGKIANSEPLLADGVEILLEKQDSEFVWHFGFSILKTDSDQKTRQWVLPDGLIKATNEIIAIEFDHGITVGKWANQLLKAIRGLASDKIDGVIYCFCFERGSSIKNVSDEELTNEFQSLVNLHRFAKPIGVITLYPHELQTDRLSKSEVIDFLETAYLNNPNKAVVSKRKAKQIVENLRTRK